MAESIIAVKDLRKRYRVGLFGRGVEALRGTTLEVGRGEIFGLLGPNGAGKTTLVKILLGIVFRTSGNAKLLGFQAGDRRGRRRVGYLPEDLRIAPHHSARSALSFYGRLSGMSQSEITKRAGQLIDLVGLKNRDAESVKRFSKGMLQRLGLAQALLHDPEVIFLDEPTDGLDPVGRNQVRTILQQLRDEGRTIFLNSHLLQEVELVCDRVAIMDQGTLRFVGSIDELTPTEETQLTVDCLGSIDKITSALSDHQILATKSNGDRHSFVIAAPDQATIDRIVDQLRSVEISIAALHERRFTLEDAFLRLVSNPES